MERDTNVQFPLVQNFQSFVADTCLLLGVLATSLFVIAATAKATFIWPIAIALADYTASVMTHTVGAFICVSACKTSLLNFDVRFSLRNHTFDL